MFKSLKKHLLVAAGIAVALCSPSIASAQEAKFVPIDLYDVAQRKNTAEGCAHLFPTGAVPNPTLFRDSSRLQGYCSDQFAVVYSPVTKTPLVVTEVISRKSLAQGQNLSRTDKFFPDPRVGREARATPKDYTRTGYDRGHLASAANQATERAMAQSFAMTNMVPQAAANNRGVWARLESDTRKYARRAHGDVFVLSGPLFSNPNPEKIGQSQVWVPSHLFKLVYDPNTQKAWAHVLPNTDDAVAGPPMSYSSFVAQTGLKLLPDIVR